MIVAGNDVRPRDWRLPRETVVLNVSRHGPPGTEGFAKRVIK